MADKECRNCKYFDTYGGGYCDAKHESTDKYGWCKYFDEK